MHHINDIIAPGLTPHYATLAREGGPWLIVSGFARQDRSKPRAPPPLINHHNECHCPLPPPLLAGWSLRTLIKTVTSFTTRGPDTALPREKQEWCTAIISFVSLFYLSISERSAAIHAALSARVSPSPSPHPHHFKRITKPPLLNFSKIEYDMNSLSVLFL